jgi:hypothetical protein
MGGTSAGTPQARKLGLTGGCRWLLDEPPIGWRLEDPPEGLVDVEHSVEPVDVVIAFFTVADQLALRLPALGQRIFPSGSLWVAWPRRAGGHRSDITDVIVRERALELGLVDVKVAAIDEDWSGLRFVWRVAARAEPRIGKGSSPRSG